MELKSKISFVLPNHLYQEFREQVIKDGYDMRAKSKWIAESIEKLLTFGNYPELVNLGNQMKGFEKKESLVLPLTLKKSMDEAVLMIRKIYPSLEGVQSGIVRVSILQRLLRS